MVCFAERPEFPIAQANRLRAGEVLVNSQLYSLWGGAVTVKIHVPCQRSVVWDYLTDYDRWPSFFPHITQSRLLQTVTPFRKRVHQGALKQFTLLKISVDAELTVREYPPYRIWFLLEEPNHNFKEFEAEVWLTDTDNDQGTFLSYTVQAAATLPIPAPFIQETMRQDLPDNLLALRQCLSTHTSAEKG